jgi:hypothetical protein
MTSLQCVNNRAVHCIEQCFAPSVRRYVALLDIPGSLGSRLVFSTPPLGNGVIDFDQLRRIRKPVTRSKGGVKAKVADVFKGRTLHAESQNEFRGFRIVLATAHPDWWLEQPFRLEYHHDGRKCRYTPDVGIGWGDYREAVEIKEDFEADLPENQSRFELLRPLLAEHGFHFRVWRKSDILAEPRLSTTSVVLRYRMVKVTRSDHEFVRRQFSLQPEISLAALDRLSPTALHVALRLILDGILYINWWAPLTWQSKVSIVPVGQQVWPAGRATAMSLAPSF